MEALDEIVREFLVESHENLDQLDRDLLALESSPDDRRLLSSIFRTIHTIKGASGFLAFPKLEHVSHVGESLLVVLRDGQLKLNQEIASGLLAMVDAIRKMLSCIEAEGSEGAADFADLTMRLETLRTGKSAASDEKPAPKAAKQESSSLSSKTSVDRQEPETAGRGAAEADFLCEPSAASTIHPSSSASATPDVLEQTQDVEAKESGACEVAPSAQPSPGKAKAKPRARKKSSNSPAAETLEQVAGPTPMQGATGLLTDGALNEFLPPTDGVLTSSDPISLKGRSGAAEAGSEHTENSGGVADSTVRIDVHILDKLMNLVGELVLARNQIMQFSHSSEDAVIVAASQRLNLITSELQEGVMKTRMQPIRNAWNKLPRVVRDLAQSCGKRIQLRMEGAETELDKTILEAIKDPLTHIVRNSVDHGIEPPDVRVAAGKAAEGILTLRAFHEGGYVNIEISDDGAGINLSRVRDKAIEKGLVSAEHAARMNDRELTNLILLPGFSTAAKVTNVSGRGVGMDVVKTNVERIGGTLDINSKFGQGTTLRIKIPLTLAIVPALIVGCRGDRFAIPQVNLLELVRLEGNSAQSQIEVIHDAPVYRLRGKLLPLVYLDEQLQLRAPRDSEGYRSGETVNIAVLQAEDQQFGLVVDQVSDTQEIVVKPLGRHLQGINVFAGATIMGDGTLALILDLLGVATHAGLVHRSRNPSAAALNAETSRESERTAYLIVDPGDGCRAAIPLAEVARLEELAADAIERAGSREWVQYRGQVMPLVRIDTPYGVNEHDPAKRTKVIVYNRNGRNVGVVVSRMVDIVEEAVSPSASGDPNVRVVGGNVTTILDLPSILRSHLADECQQEFESEVYNG